MKLLELEWKCSGMWSYRKWNDKWMAWILNLLV
jgi:hypothetical protein